MKALPDAADRRRAATDFRTNLVVTAGAGTGKTSLLVERILNGCLGEGIDLASVAAITFTEKAGAEMRDRLSGALEEMARIVEGRADPATARQDEAVRSLRHLREDRGLDAAETGRRIVAALRGLDQVRVGTIHSLCADLLRRHPREAGVDPGFRVDDGGAWARLADREAREWLEAEFGEGGGREAEWSAILLRVRLGKLPGMAGEIAATPLPLDADSLRAQREAAAESLRARCRTLADEIEAAESRAGGLRENLARHLEVCREALRKFAADGAEALEGEIEFPTQGVPKPGAKVTGMSGEDLEDVGLRARKLLENCLKFDPTADRCIDLLAPGAERIRRRFAEDGYLSFSDLLQRARDLLRDHPEARRIEKQRIRALLVDEFQDTDPLQYEILFFLAEREDGERSDPWAAPLAPGKLFIVGDPKQSIYRFRGADIGAYREAVERVVRDGGAILSLTGNFRSPEEILDPLNRLFPSAFAAGAPEQVEYAGITAARGAAGDGPRVRIWTVPPEEGSARVEFLRRHEGRVIADWIAAAHRAGTRRFRDVAILLQAMSDVHLYLRPLREARIPFVVEGGRIFGRKPEVREFLCLLKTLVNPNDEVALLAVLRSPLGAATDVELARHAAGGGEWRLGAAADPERCPNIHRTLADLRTLRERVRGLPPDAAVRLVLDATNLVEFNAAAYEGGQRVANLIRIADRVAHRARREHLSLEETVRGLEREFEQDEGEDPESPLADEALDAVRVLTVHRAKGLEFPVVILPDLGRRPNIAAASLPGVDPIWTGRGRRVLAVRAPGRSDPAWNAAAVLNAERARREEEAERIRCLYVACTRAREELILVASSAGKSLWTDSLNAWGYRWEGGDPLAAGAFLGGAVGHELRSPAAEIPAVQSAAPSEEAIAAAVGRFEEARRKAEALRHRLWIETPTGIREMREAAFDEDRAPRPARGPSAAAPSPVARAAGIAVHRLLERWDREDLLWLRRNAGAAADAGARDEGADPAAVRGAVEEILAGFLGSDLPRRLQEAEVLGREVPFEAADDDRLLRGSIDLLYRRAGRFVVADFKTDDVEPGREESLIGKYAPQIEAYGRAVRRALALEGPPDREIWSIRTGRVVAVPAGDPTPPRRGG